MTYNVFSGMLNRTQSIDSLDHVTARKLKRSAIYNAVWDGEAEFTIAIIYCIFTS